MSLTVPIALFGWIPVVFLLFAVLSAQRATLWAILLAWLFLPMTGYHIDGLPDINKQFVCLVTTLVAAAIFDTARLMSFRPRWIDLPVLLLCLCPIASSFSGGFGVHGAISCSLSPIILWGIPYFLGRVYFSDPGGLRMLARGFFIGGLIYVPFCLFEIRFTPNLHYFIYGFHQHQFLQQIRLGGYRPMVFMQHGLAVGMWMTMASLAGVWLCSSRALDKVWGFKPFWPTVILVATTILCRSTGAMMLLAVGLVVLYATRYLRRHVLTIALMIFPVFYIGGRTSGLWSGRELLDVAALVAPEDRVSSLEGRMIQEDLLVFRALQRPVFGWAGWGLNRDFVHRETHEEVRAVTDGMWVIALGLNGIFGLSMLYLTMLLPVGRFFLLHKARWIGHPAVGPPAVLSIILVLYAIDSLINAMPNPMCVLVVGALSGMRAAMAPERVVSRNTPFVSNSRLAIPPRPVGWQAGNSHA